MTKSRRHFPHQMQIVFVQLRFSYLYAPGNRILISLSTELRILKCQCSDERCVQTGWIEQSMETCSVFHLLFGIWVYVFAFICSICLYILCISYIFWFLSLLCLFFCFVVQYEWIKQSTDHCSTFLSPLICSIVCNEIAERLPETSSFRNLTCLDDISHYIIST